jgi:hypothetical protein
VVIQLDLSFKGNFITTIDLSPPRDAWTQSVDAEFRSFGREIMLIKKRRAWTD